MHFSVGGDRFQRGRTIAVLIGIHMQNAAKNASDSYDEMQHVLQQLHCKHKRMGAEKYFFSLQNL